jgi:hypothetical protein
MNEKKNRGDLTKQQLAEVAAAAKDVFAQRVSGGKGGGRGPKGAAAAAAAGEGGGGGGGGGSADGGKASWKFWVKK